MPEQELPVLLPEVKSFISGEDGKSVLEGLTDWVNTKCPGCGGPAKRETDTMPQWAGSSGTFSGILIPIIMDSLPPAKILIIGFRWTGITEGWSTQHCTYYTPGSGINFCMTKVLCLVRNRTKNGPRTV